MDFQKFIEESDSAAFLVYAESKQIVAANGLAQEMFGYNFDELVGKNIKVIMNDHDQAHHDTYVNQYLETGEKKVIGRGRSVVGKTKEGIYLSLYLRVELIELKAEKYYLGLLHHN